MKSILCVHQGYELYGSDRTFIQSVKALRLKWPDSYITVHLPQSGLLSDKIHIYCNKIIIGGFSVLRKRTFTIKSISNFIRNSFYNYQLIKKQDFIYINSAVLFSYIFLTFFRKYHSIIHIHEIPVGLTRFYFYILSLLSRSKIIANSYATKNGLFRNRNISVLYNGVKDIGTDLIEEQQSKNFHLSLIGRLNSWKGQNIAIEAVFLLVKNGITDIKLNIVGSYFDNNHYYLSYLKEMVHYYRLEEYVEFYYFSMNVSEHYQQSDIILVPSINPEPFGLVAIEAMNFSLPVIASNHGGLSEIVIDGETGKLVQPNSAQDLADAIELYYHDRLLANNHGQNGRKRFLEYFEEENYNQNFLQIVEKYAR